MIPQHSEHCHAGTSHTFKRHTGHFAHVKFLINYSHSKKLRLGAVKWAAYWLPVNAKRIHTQVLCSNLTLLTSELHQLLRERTVSFRWWYTFPSYFIHSLAPPTSPFLPYRCPWCCPLSRLETRGPRHASRLQLQFLGSLPIWIPPLCLQQLGH